MRYFLRVPTAHYFSFIGQGAENILGLVGLSVSPSLGLESYKAGETKVRFVVESPRPLVRHVTNYHSFLYTVYLA